MPECSKKVDYSLSAERRRACELHASGRAEPRPSWLGYPLFSREAPQNEIEGMILIGMINSLSVDSCHDEQPISHTEQRKLFSCLWMLPTFSMVKCYCRSNITILHLLKLLLLSLHWYTHQEREPVLDAQLN